MRRKISSMFMAVVFLTQTVMAQTPSVYQIAVPEESGKVTQRFKGADEKIIIHIQDAHSSFDAQKNLAKIIHALLPQLRESGIPFVGIEGAMGEYDLKRLRDFPDHEARQVVAEEYVQDGKFIGAELASITANQDFKLFGLEDRSLFVRNFQAFYQVMQKKSDIEEQIKKIEQALERLKDRVYHDALRTFDQEAGDYANGKQELLPWLTRIFDVASKQGLDLMDFVSLSQFREVAAASTKFEHEDLKGEIVQLAEVLIGLLSPTDQEKLSADIAAYQLNQKTEKDVVRSLYGEAVRQKIDRQAYPNIRAAYAYWQKWAAADIGQVLGEVSLAAWHIREHLASTKEEKLLVDLTRRFEELQRVLSLEAVRENVTAYRSDRLKYSLRFLFKGMDHLAQRTGLVMAMPDWKEGDALLSLADEFYGLAEARDHAMLENLIRQMESKGQKIGVLIAGGYHSDGIVQMLKQRHISFLTVRPNIDDLNATVAYLDRMMGKIAPLDPVLTSHFQMSQIVGTLGAVAGTDARLDVEADAEPDMMEQTALGAQEQQADSLLREQTRNEDNKYSLKNIEARIAAAHRQLAEIGIENIKPFALRGVSQQFYKKDDQNPFGGNPSYPNSLFYVGIDPASFLRDKAWEGGGLGLRSLSVSDREKYCNEFFTRLFNTFTTRLINFGNDDFRLESTSLDKTPVFIVLRGFRFANSNQSDDLSREPTVGFSSPLKALSVAVNPNYMDWYSKTASPITSVSLANESAHFQLDVSKRSLLHDNLQRYLKHEVRPALSAAGYESGESNIRILEERYVAYCLYSDFIEWLLVDTKDAMLKKEQENKGDAKRRLPFERKTISVTDPKALSSIVTDFVQSIRDENPQLVSDRTVSAKFFEDFVMVVDGVTLIDSLEALEENQNQLVTEGVLIFRRIRGGSGRGMDQYADQNYETTGVTAQRADTVIEELTTSDAETQTQTIVASAITQNLSQGIPEFRKKVYERIEARNGASDIFIETRVEDNHLAAINLNERRLRSKDAEFIPEELNAEVYASLFKVVENAVFYLFEGEFRDEDIESLSLISTPPGAYHAFKEVKARDLLGDCPKLTQEQMEFFLGKDAEKLKQYVDADALQDVIMRLGAKGGEVNLLGMLHKYLVDVYTFETSKNMEKVKEAVKRLMASSYKFSKVIGLGRVKLYDANHHYVRLAEDEVIGQLSPLHGTDFTVIPAAEAKTYQEFIGVVMAKTEEEKRSHLYVFHKVFHQTGRYHVLAARNGNFEIYYTSDTYSRVTGRQQWQRQEATMAEGPNFRYQDINEEKLERQLERENKGPLEQALADLIAPYSRRDKLFGSSDGIRDIVRMSLDSFIEEIGEINIPDELRDQLLKLGKAAVSDSYAVRRFIKNVLVAAYGDALINRETISLGWFGKPNLNFVPTFSDMDALEHAHQLSPSAANAISMLLAEQHGTQVIDLNEERNEEEARNFIDMHVAIGLAFSGQGRMVSRNPVTGFYQDGNPGGFEIDFERYRNWRSMALYDRVILLDEFIASPPLYQQKPGERVSNSEVVIRPVEKLQATGFIRARDEVVSPRRPEAVAVDEATRTFYAALGRRIEKARSNAAVIQESARRGAFIEAETGADYKKEKFAGYVDGNDQIVMAQEDGAIPNGAKVAFYIYRVSIFTPGDADRTSPERVEFNQYQIEMLPVQGGARDADFQQYRDLISMSLDMLNNGAPVQAADFTPVPAPGIQVRTLTNREIEAGLVPPIWWRQGPHTVLVLEGITNKAGRMPDHKQLSPDEVRKGLREGKILAVAITYPGQTEHPQFVFAEHWPQEIALPDLSEKAHEQPAQEAPAGENMGKHVARALGQGEIEAFLAGQTSESIQPVYNSIVVSDEELSLTRLKGVDIDSLKVGLSNGTYIIVEVNGIQQIVFSNVWTRFIGQGHVKLLTSSAETLPDSNNYEVLGADFVDTHLSNNAIAGQLTVYPTVLTDSQQTAYFSFRVPAEGIKEKIQEGVYILVRVNGIEQLVTREAWETFLSEREKETMQDRQEEAAGTVSPSFAKVISRSWGEKEPELSSQQKELVVEGRVVYEEQPVVVATVGQNFIEEGYVIPEIHLYRLASESFDRENSNKAYYMIKGNRYYGISLHDHKNGAHVHATPALWEVLNKNEDMLKAFLAHEALDGLTHKGRQISHAEAWQITAALYPDGTKAFIKLHIDDLERDRNVAALQDLAEEYESALNSLHYGRIASGKWEAGEQEAVNSDAQEKVKSVEEQIYHDITMALKRLGESREALRSDIAQFNRLARSLVVAKDFRGKLHDAKEYQKTQLAQSGGGINLVINPAGLQPGELEMMQAFAEGEGITTYSPEKFAAASIDEKVINLFVGIKAPDDSMQTRFQAIAKLSADPIERTVQVARFPLILSALIWTAQAKAQSQEVDFASLGLFQNLTAFASENTNLIAKIHEVIASRSAAVAA